MGTKSLHVFKLTEMKLAVSNFELRVRSALTVIETLLVNIIDLAQIAHETIMSNSSLNADAMKAGFLHYTRAGGTRRGRRHRLSASLRIIGAGSHCRE